MLDSREILVLVILLLGVSNGPPAASAQVASGSRAGASSAHRWRMEEPADSVAGEFLPAGTGAGAMPGQVRWRNFPFGLRRTATEGLFDAPRRRFLLVEPDAMEAQILDYSHGGRWSSAGILGSGPRSSSVSVLDAQRERALVIALDPSSTDAATRLQLWELKLTAPMAWTRLDHGALSWRYPGFPYGAKLLLDVRRSRLLLFHNVLQYRALEAVSLEEPTAFTPVTAPFSWVGDDGECVALDTLHDRLVVFGGRWEVQHHGYFSGYYNTVQVLPLGIAGAEWSSGVAIPGPAPAPRAYGSLLFDAARDCFYVAGGVGDLDTRDVWRLDLTAEPRWTRLSGAESPAAAFTNSPDAVDAESGEVLLYSEYPRDAAWAFEPVRREWRAIALRKPDVMTLGPGSLTVLDSRRNRLLQQGVPYSIPFGTTTAAISVPGSGEVTWTGLSPGPARSFHGGAYDAERDRLIILMGEAGAPTNDVWQLPLSDSGGWSELHPEGPLPEVRSQAAIAFDPLGRRFIVHGGRSRGDGAPSLLHDTWCLELEPTPRWRLLIHDEESPVRMTAARAVYDPDRHRILLLGDELWEMRLGGALVWTKLEAAGMPESSPTAGGVVYDEVRDALVAVTRAGEFELRLDSTRGWTQLSSTRTPPWLGNSSLFGRTPVHDPSSDQLVVPYGFNSVWALDRGQPLQRVELDVGPAVAAAEHAGAPVRCRVLGSKDVDVRDIIGASLRLCGAAPMALPPGLAEKRFSDQNKDGYSDLLLQFRREELVDPFSRGAPLVLRGTTAQGAPIRGAWLPTTQVRKTERSSVEGLLHGDASGSGVHAAFITGSLHLGIAPGPAGPATLECFDVQGRRLALRHLLLPGDRQTEVEVTESSAWPSGLIFVRLRQGRAHYTTRVVRL